MEKELRARITADNSDFNRKTQETERGSKSFANKMVGFAKMIGAAWVFKKAYDSLKQLIGGMMDTADRLRDLSDMTGISTDALQEYEYVAKIAGVNTEALANASMGLTQRLARATSEASPLNIALKQLGVEARDATGSLRNGADIMEDVIGQLAEMDNVTERNVLGAQIFSGAWKDMAPILAMGADGIAQLRQEARDMGIIMNEDALDAANNLRIAKVRLKEASGALGREIGSALIPALTALTEKALDAVNAMRTLKNGLSAVANDEDLKWWQKLGTFLGIAVRDTRSLATMFGSMAKEQLKSNDVVQQSTQGYAAFIDEAEDVVEVLEEIVRTAPEVEHSFNVSEQAVIELDFAMQNLEETAQRTFTELDLWTVIMANNFKIMEEAARSFGEQVMWASVNGANSMQEYSRIVAQTAKKNIAALLAESVAATIRAHVGLGPFGVLAAGVAAGAVAAMFNSLVPAFAKGGAVSGPTLALVGEGPGVSRSNPEYIGTAQQLKGMMGGGTLTARVSRGDLLFILNEGNLHNNRTF